jgi:cellulose synthase/poly-beta-1,6-N-acetylglucosamine synthase-like glycosyltransferase
VPEPLSIENQILAREPGDGDDIWGSLVLLFFDFFQSHQSRDRSDPGTAGAHAAAAATLRARVPVVRPLCGLDNFCEETLQSSFELDYPSYEIIFCVARATDPAVPLVQRLIANHPEKPTRLIVGDEKVSANPKLNNRVRGWDAARHDWIILADANLLIPKD